nr:alpha-ketoacid dehydrogenase subunit beta [Sphingomonas sp. Y57]
MNSSVTSASRRNRVERKLTIAKAINEAIAQEMRADPRVFVMGEDIGAIGGIWGHTGGLLDEFGADRVRDTPISETAFIGAAVGAANLGMRPIVELMFVDFFGVCMDAIYNLAAKSSYHSNGRFKAPMVILTAIGGGYSDSTQHSQCLYATFAHLPGLKIVLPSNAYDAKGLLTSAIRDDNPVLFMFHKNLQGMGFLGTVKTAITDVPDDGYEVPIGVANIVRPGRDVTLVGLGATVHQAMEAAGRLSRQGVDAEVIDLRSIVPLDRNAIVRSVTKTGRMLVIDDDYRNCGLAGEIIATVAELGVPLRAPLRRLTYPDIPTPFARPMEQFALPNADRIVEEALNLVTGAGK